MLATWSYRERPTFIQRLDPRARIIAMFALTLATAMIWDLRLTLIPFGLTLLALYLARLTWKEVRRFVIVVSFFIGFLTLLTLLTGRGGVSVFDVEHPIWHGRMLGLTITISVERLAF